MTARAQFLDDESPAARATVDVAGATLVVAGVTLVADLSGALFWEEQGLLVVSDLHLEKGSSFATRGVLLPPYDTVATLGRLAAVIARHDPRMVIALGDSFHDRDAHDRLSATDREALSALQARRDWIWISGNHDPALPSDLGGVVAEEVAIGPIAFRHEPSGASGEIAGHLHPKARVSTRGRSMERRCFACDGERAVMPAFGAYAGGLSIRDAAFAKIFQATGLHGACARRSQAAHHRRVAVLLIVSRSGNVEFSAPRPWRGHLVALDLASVSEGRCPNASRYSLAKCPGFEKPHLKATPMTPIWLPAASSSLARRSRVILAKAIGEYPRLRANDRNNARALVPAI